MLLTRSALAFAAALMLGAQGLGVHAEPPAPGWTLERVVMVERHGVRSPTKSPQDLAPLAAEPWPAWPVEPGELTSHGAAGVRLMGSALQRIYTQAGLISPGTCGAGTISIWADGADHRTVETGDALAASLGAGCQVQARHGPLGESDALFDSLSASVCALDPSAATQAVKVEAGAGGLVSPDSAAALHALQAVAAPEGCQGQGQDKGGKGGEGVCLAGETTLGASPTGVKLVGPLAVGATLAENLFLEEAEGFPPAQVGWGRLSANGGLETVMAAHERMSDLTRRTPYIAQRRGVTLARAILKALDPSSPSDPHAPPSPQGAKVIAFVGHDTNLANMAGVFGLRWTLPDQPDATAPATVLAFELWREGTSDRRVVRTVIYYETLSQLRTLKPQSISSVPLSFAGCAEGVAGVCPLPRLTAQVGKALADACPAH